MLDKPGTTSCPFCHAEIPSGVTVCYYCGRDLLYDPLPVDASPTQPVRLNNPPRQPLQQVGPPYVPPPYGPPPYTTQPPYSQPAYTPPPPADNHLPTWLMIFAGLSVLLIFAAGVGMVIILLTSRNGVGGQGPQVFGGAESGNPTPSETAPAYTPTPLPTFTPVPTDTPQPTVTPQPEASPTPNPTQASLADKLLSPECKSSLDQLSKVSDQVKNDPLKVLDETWRKDVDQAVADMKTYCGSLDSASPVPGEVGQVQKLVNQTTSEFDQAKLLWNQAIDEHDPGKAISAAQHVGQAANYLGQAMSLLQKLVP